MSSYTVYIFQFCEHGDVVRIPYAKWNRIRAGDEIVEEYSNQAIYIAYAYLLLENRTPDYCPRIEGAIYYFDMVGRVIIEQCHYFDLLQDLEEDTGNVINLHHHKKKKSVAKKYQWTLNSEQIQAMIDCIW